MKTTVYRDMWFRGKGAGESGLLLKTLDGPKMCCLGFVGLACGITPLELSQAKSPASVTSVEGSLRNVINPNKWAAGVVNIPGPTALGENTNPCVSAMEENDAAYELSREEIREANITRALALAGVEVTFEDVAPADLRSRLAGVCPAHA